MGLTMVTLYFMINWPPFFPQEFNLGTLYSMVPKPVPRTTSYHLVILNVSFVLYRHNIRPPPTSN